MLTVFVEHYLTPEGRMYFPAWLSDVRRALADVKGFRTLDSVEDVERPERQLLLLHFDSTESLLRWSSSAEHLRLMKLMERYQVRRPYTQLLQAAG